jgi:hypothetical protein
LVDPPLPHAGQFGAFPASLLPSSYWPEEHCAETLTRRRVLKRRRRVIEFLDSARIVVIFGLFLEKMIRRALVGGKKGFIDSI